MTVMCLVYNVFNKHYLVIIIEHLVWEIQKG